MFREEVPEKAGLAYPQVVTGMGRRALVRGRSAVARSQGAPLQRADTLVGMEIEPPAAASKTGDHVSWRRTLIISTACVFMCGILSVSLVVSGSWLNTQTVFHDPTSRTLYDAMRPRTFLSLRSLPPVVLLSIHHLSNQSKVSGRPSYNLPQ